MIYILIAALSICGFCHSEAKAVLQDGFLKGVWQKEVKTVEDQERALFFQSLFAKAQTAEKSLGDIPKIFHIIWLGPATLPPQFVTKVRTWIAHHPGWKIKLWTDQDRLVSIPSMELCSVRSFPLEDLADYYYSAENFDERSVILRYAILLNEGGIYIDHDMECIASLEVLRSSYDFFCGLEIPGISMRSSSINPSCHFIAAAVNHPILLRVKQYLMAHWYENEELFPGTDQISMTNRMVHRSMQALSAAIEQVAGKDRKDAVFPPHYFSSSLSEHAIYAITPLKALFGQRIRQGQENEKMQGAMGAIRKQLRIYTVLIYALAALNLFLGAVIFHLYRKGKLK